MNNTRPGLTKKNEIIVFARKLMELEIILLTEQARLRQILHASSHVQKPDLNLYTCHERIHVVIVEEDILREVRGRNRGQQNMPARGTMETGEDSGRGQIRTKYKGIYV